MRKMMLMAFVASVVALMLAASPASADEKDDCEWVWDWDDKKWVLVCEDDGKDDGHFIIKDDGHHFIDHGCWLWDGLKWIWICPDNGFFFGDGGLAVELDDVTSGDVTIDNTVLNTGDNSNQAVAIQNAVNTGNVVNVQGFGGFTDGICWFDGINFCVDHHGSFDDLEVEGGSITVSPTLSFTADQSVNQAAAVFVK